MFASVGSRHRCLSQHSGYLYQVRYRSIICEEEGYFLELLRYIHLNPVQAGMVNSLGLLADYPWTGTVFCWASSHARGSVRRTCLITSAIILNQRSNSIWRLLPMGLSVLARWTLTAEALLEAWQGRASWLNYEMKRIGALAMNASWVVAIL